MATVVSKTSIKIDDLINDTVISGAVIDGQLILVTRGGAEINAGSINKTWGLEWSAAANYLMGDVVGYAGGIWKASADSINKPPYYFTSLWSMVSGVDSNDWAERDPYFEGINLGQAWNTVWKTGTTTVSLTSVAGEFEDGHQALKIAMGPNSSQRVYQQIENLIKGSGEKITSTVRAKVLSGSTGVATIIATLNQNDQLNIPEPLSPGAVFTDALEGPKTLTTSWQTFTFTMNAVDFKPRSMVNFLVVNSPAGSSNVVIDWTKTGRQGSGGGGGTGTSVDFGFASPTTTWTLTHNLGTKNVDVTTLDTTGAIVYGDVACVDVNTAIVTWYVPMTGSAIVQR